jgi:hypothetical protein
VCSVRFVMFRGQRKGEKKSKNKETLLCEKTVDLLNSIVFKDKDSSVHFIQ